MAIYSSVPPPGQQQATSTSSQHTTQLPSTTAATGIDIESWSATAISSLNISSSSGVTLCIPLDDATTSKRDARDAPKPRKELARRDSQKKRDALLKGKEGSRRRQRWENDHLLHVPNAQSPLPSDWQVHSTSPIRHVPYFLAPLWDAGVRNRADEIASAKRLATAQRAGVSPTDTKGRVPQELRQKLKKAKGAKTLLQDLEEEIRKFVRDYERKERHRLNHTRDSDDDAEPEPEMDTDDEEIVFVGRDGTMSDEQRKNIEVELQKEKMVFDSLVGDQSAGFGRWLVHSIASYYGLTSRSVTVSGNPERREAWVGIREMKAGRVKMGTRESDLPRPLWGMI